MDPNIWQDIQARLRNLRGDIVVQFLGDLDNSHVEQTISLLTATIQAWQRAKPTSSRQAP